MQQSKITVINILSREAKKSQITQQLAAAITKGNKIVSKPYCNSMRNTCKGASFGSLHAEARAIINYYGRSIVFDRKFGWYVKQRNNQKSKT